jgi:hypothetical protein
MGVQGLKRNVQPLEAERFRALTRWASRRLVAQRVLWSRNAEKSTQFFCIAI